jgi:hypothetical protein
VQLLERSGECVQRRHLGALVDGIPSAPEDDRAAEQS